MNDNFARGDKAAKALETIGVTDLKADSEVAPGYPISDLIANLCHLMQREGLDVNETIEIALMQYGSDCVEQAWENADDWHDEFDDASNLPRAQTVLIACRVPERLHDRVLRATGMLPPLPRDDDEADPD